MKTVLLLACLAGIPAAAFAQAAVAGSVKDSFGDPIAGAIVEVSGPALIERSRTTVTNGAGRYRIENLRPGTYEVRFSRQA